MALENTRTVRDPLGGDRLYRNDGGHFVDVSAAAGIYGSEIGLGLGVVVSDVNADGWPDIYVANDFFERDYLYINKGDGTFSERLEQEMPYISLSSMGLDIADVNNDGWPDVYVVDMLPDDERRLKTTTSFENWHRLESELKNGFHYQFTRNMLHLNNGNGTFSDIGQLAGVARGLELERSHRGPRFGRLQGHLRHERPRQGRHVTGLHRLPGERRDDARGDAGQAGRLPETHRGDELDEAVALRVP